MKRENKTFYEAGNPVLTDQQSPCVEDRAEIAANGHTRAKGLHRAGTNASGTPDLVCLSHLRWDFVYQRPQHLMSRFARDRRVFFIEEPILDGDTPGLKVSTREGVQVVVPRLPESLSAPDAASALETLLRGFFSYRQVERYVLWYYTPMALSFTQGLDPLAVVYDCMDELSLFKGAPPALREHERELFRRADLVFTGGASLYEVKRERHPSVHLFPSSIDRAHFAQARQPLSEREDQAAIAHPRLGFFGVIDERFDAALLEGAAAARPDWQFVIVGPVVKIDPATLPRRANIHYLGGKPYKELPAYLSGWDAALLLFARNEATRFISPTKTPEYLAGGRPVISTSIRDVVRPYGEEGLVEIADSAEALVEAAERLFGRTEAEQSAWLRKVDAFLEQMSWDRTWAGMDRLIEKAVARTPAL